MVLYVFDIHTRVTCARFESQNRDTEQCTVLCTFIKWLCNIHSCVEPNLTYHNQHYYIVLHI